MQIKLILSGYVLCTFNFQNKFYPERDRTVWNTQKRVPSSFFLAGCPQGVGAQGIVVRPVSLVIIIMPSTSEFPTLNYTQRLCLYTHIYLATLSNEGHIDQTATLRDLSLQKPPGPRH